MILWHTIALGLSITQLVEQDEETSIKPMPSPSLLFDDSPCGTARFPFSKASAYIRQRLADWAKFFKEDLDSQEEEFYQVAELKIAELSAWESNLQQRREEVEAWENDLSNYLETWNNELDMLDIELEIWEIDLEKWENDLETRNNNFLLAKRQWESDLKALGNDLNK